MIFLNIRGVEKQTWVRMGVLLVLLINQVSTSIFGFNLLPYEEKDIYEGVSTLATIIATIWTAWKNNSFTYEGQLTDEQLKELKLQRKGE